MNDLKIYVAGGEDTYRSWKWVEAFCDKGREKEMEIKKVEGDELDVIDIQQGGGSLFGGTRVLIVRNFMKFKKEKEDDVLKSLKKAQGIFVFWEGGKIKKTNRIVKKGELQVFDLLEGAQLRSWVDKKIEELKLDIDSGAVNEVINRVGSDLWRMENELIKLRNVGGRISFDQIDEIVKGEVDTNVFNTIDALAEGNRSKALECLEKHYIDGDDPIYILAMYVYQFRNLLAVADLVEQGRPIDAKKLKMAPFVIQKTKNQVGRFPKGKLEQIYAKVKDLDLAVKTGKVVPKVALNILVASLTR